MQTVPQHRDRASSDDSSGASSNYINETSSQSSKYIMTSQYFFIEQSCNGSGRFYSKFPCNYSPRCGPIPKCEHINLIAPVRTVLGSFGSRFDESRSAEFPCSHSRVRGERCAISCP